ncbi:MAG: HD domain-containing protein [Cytophagales bacterium]
MISTKHVSIENEYKNLSDKLFPFIKSQEQELINKAFRVAYNAHKGVSRLSNAPYITHAINVAYIVAIEMKLDPVCVAVALLHDVLEDTETQLEDIEQNFGKEIAMMVDGLTKINNHSVVRYTEKLKSLQKLLKATIKDTRIIFIKIADRLDNMRSINFLPRTRQLYIASETKEVYAKIVSLLGLEEIKREMEDLCLKTIHSQKYYMLDTLIKKQATEKEHEKNEFIASITSVLKSYDISFTIQTRSKSISSIHDKMRKKCISFHEIYDFIGVRIIISNKNEQLNCWRIYGIITSRYRVDKKRTKDWITNPKEKEGYQSLHLTVIGSKGSAIEVQIRTERMHDIASKGQAAHWKYKEKDLATILKNLDEWSHKALDRVQYQYKKLKKRFFEKTAPSI